MGFWFYVLCGTVLRHKLKHLIHISQNLSLKHNNWDDKSLGISKTVWNHAIRATNVCNTCLGLSTFMSAKSGIPDPFPPPPFPLTRIHHHLPDIACFHWSCYSINATEGVFCNSSVVCLFVIFGKKWGFVCLLSVEGKVWRLCLFFVIVLCLVCLLSLASQGLFVCYLCLFVYCFVCLLSLFVIFVCLLSVEEKCGGGRRWWATLTAASLLFVCLLSFFVCLIVCFLSVCLFVIYIWDKEKCGGRR